MWNSKSSVAVACFLPGRAKDLSTPPYKNTLLTGIRSVYFPNLGNLKKGGWGERLIAPIASPPWLRHCCSEAVISSSQRHTTCLCAVILHYMQRPSYGSVSQEVLSGFSTVSTYLSFFYVWYGNTSRPLHCIKVNGHKVWSFCCCYVPPCSKYYIFSAHCCQIHWISFVPRRRDGK